MKTEQEYYFNNFKWVTVSEAQELIAEFMYEEERMILATGYNWQQIQLQLQ